MGRRSQLLLALALMSAACGTAGDAADHAGTSSPTATSSSSSTTTSTPATTTTTEADPCEGEPFSIDNRGGRLIPGCVHRTDDFGPTSILFTTDDDWWLTFADGDPRLVRLGIDVDGDGGADGGLAFIAWNSDLTSELLLAQLDSIDGVNQVDAAVGTPVAGTSALRADFDAEEEPVNTSFLPCTTTGLSFFGDGPGYQLITVGGDQDIGLPACNRTRAWAVELGEETIIIIAAANDPERFNEFMPIFDGFLMNSVTFGTGDG